MLLFAVGGEMFVIAKQSITLTLTASSRWTYLTHLYELLCTLRFVLQLNKVIKWRFENMEPMWALHMNNTGFCTRTPDDKTLSTMLLFMVFSRSVNFFCVIKNVAVWSSSLDSNRKVLHVLIWYFDYKKPGECFFVANTHIFNIV